MCEGIVQQQDRAGAKGCMAATACSCVEMLNAYRIYMAPADGQGYANAKSISLYMPHYQTNHVRGKANDVY